MLKKVLIIIGASKSGSTVLAKSLGGHPKTFTLGEANRFNEELNNPDGVCSCGKSLVDCTFWRRIRTILSVLTPLRSLMNFQWGCSNSTPEGKTFSN